MTACIYAGDTESVVLALMPTCVKVCPIMHGTMGKCMDLKMSLVLLALKNNITQQPFVTPFLCLNPP